MMNQTEDIKSYTEMMNDFGETETVFSDELYYQFNWYYQNFLPAVQKSSDEFFFDGLSFKLCSVSKNINALFQGDNYFVTKVRLDKQHDIFLRCSEDAVNLILTKILDKNEKKFDFNKVTDLEAKIITAFNDYAYQNLAEFLTMPADKMKKRKNFDMIHLTFYLKDNAGGASTKFIISIPEVVLNPQVLQKGEEKFNDRYFKNSLVEVNIKVGTTNFKISDLKDLEKDDIVLFEKSNSQTMQLLYRNYKKEFRITPNAALIISIDDTDDGGDEMNGNIQSAANLWDSIQVEMSAEFDKVKISLGELKNIEDGLVVDVGSIYNNNITLRVEDKIIGHGELVIINDRYGVRISEIYAHKDEEPRVAPPPPPVKEEIHPRAEEVVPQPAEPQPIPQEVHENDEEEFDYSDFELDDDI